MRFLPSPGRMRRRQLLLLALLLAAVAAIGLLARRGAPGGSAHRVAEPRPAAVREPADLPPEVRSLLREGRNWRAARRMRDYLAARPRPAPEAVLLAARAEAGWGGWENVRVLLQGKPWLDRVGGGEGWLLLARALEEDGEWAGAAAAYGRYLGTTPEEDPSDRRVVAELRRGLALLRLGRVGEGTAALDRVRAHEPGLSGWAATLMAEALAEPGDTARIRALLGESGEGGSADRMRRAHVRASLAAGDPAGARALALRYRAATEGNPARAELTLLAARAALRAGDRGAAGAELRALVGGMPGTASAPEAARLLRELGGITPDDRLALARVYDRHRADARAAEEYRAWLAAGRGTPARRREVRYVLGRTLFEAGRHAEAEAALRPLAEGRDGLAADALFLTGRAQVRGGSPRRAQATLLRLAERFPRTRRAADALFLVADLAHDAGETARAGALYRRVAREFPGSGRAGASLMRLGGTAFAAGDSRGALAAWEELRKRFPSGDFGLQGTYWSGRALQALGDSAAARARFREVRVREPLSYYAVLAAERLGERFWPVPTGPAPPPDPEGREEVEGWMHTLDLLRAAGLHAEAEAEADRLARRAEDGPRTAYPLAEALLARGHTVQAIRMGQRLHEREGRWNPRLLRIVYPFPYRELISAEARERGLDPFLVAALTRQESTFRARISSPVGARGLMQVMPETGRQLARGAGIRQWDAELLFNPEINTHLGVRYLADQVRAYGGVLPYVFSAYNAGPHRVDRWRRLFPERRDTELFTERIPYQETRDYVKILTRNMAVYRGLYGG